MGESVLDLRKTLQKFPRPLTSPQFCLLSRGVSRLPGYRPGSQIPCYPVLPAQNLSQQPTWSHQETFQSCSLWFGTTRRAVAVSAGLLPDLEGAGQDVGRSCILVSIAGKNVMLDCGMHMGFNDDRRFPDFSYITQNGRLTDFLDCVIISHFHLDHCGALPYFSEMVGYDGPIYMTHPTQAICPILLEDYRKIAVDKKGEANFFTSQMVKDCMKKVVAVHLHQTVQVDDELEIKAYYAGHVLGAAMFQIKVGSESVVYTGDYNMTPDRHLGAAWIDKCRPNLLITESTYATTIRDSKRCRERDFLKKVHEAVERGGKVLIPVFALGRAQELCILLETFWERMNLKAPIYFSTGLTEKANHYYKLFITWTNQKIRKTFVQRNMFEFKHIKAFDRAFADNPGPMVVFATPGMLHAGQSLQIFRKWAGNEKNMVIMPGYCVQGTVGHKILSGQRKLEMEGRQVCPRRRQGHHAAGPAGRAPERAAGARRGQEDGVPQAEDRAGVPRELLHAGQWRDRDAAHTPQHPRGHLPGAAEAGDGARAAP
nr:integrator complex subunit 11 isoform X4 [Dasypus novemcinctus]